jgi:hypothetical protein
MTGNAGKRRDYNSDPGDGAEEPTEPTGVGRQRRTIKRPFSKRRNLLSQEHGFTIERVRLRFFPLGGKDAGQTFRCTGKGTVAGQFLHALGVTNTLCSPNSLYLLTIGC